MRLFIRGAGRLAGALLRRARSLSHSRPAPALPVHRESEQPSADINLLKIVINIVRR
jgi:hypothetical protein